MIELPTKPIDSQSMGDGARFRSLDELERGLGDLPEAPRDSGELALVVARREGGGLRETPGRTRLAQETGVPGDAWGRYRKRDPEAQLTVIQMDVALLIANGQPVTLFGDNLFLSLDLSQGNLPIGSRVRVGGAVLEVTPMPHNGCKKFRARFGPEALEFVSKPELRHRNLRGIYMRVIEDGDVACGDAATVIARP